jgi:hypothetical protein
VFFISDSKPCNLLLITIKLNRNTILNDISQDKLAQITAEIASKNFVLTSALDVAKEMKERIIANNSKKSGLCIRCLNKKNLQGVLDFLGPQSSAIVVCKYWRLCLKQ